jgi:hypothetical protein
VPKHLWEVTHPVYGGQSNFYDKDCHDKYETWAEFATSSWDDLDLHFLWRWDWREYPKEGEPNFNSDPYYRNGELELFFIYQRKALAHSATVRVCRADEPAVKAWLQKRLDYLKTVWEPMFEET